MKTLTPSLSVRGSLAAAVLAFTIPASAQTEAAKIPDLGAPSLSLHQALNLSGDRASKVDAIEHDAAKSVERSRIATGLDQARFARDLSSIERDRDAKLLDLLGPVEFARYQAWQRDRLAESTARAMREALGLSAEQAGRAATIQRQALESLASIPAGEPAADRQADLRGIEKTRDAALASVLSPEQMKAYRSGRDRIVDQARASLIAQAD